MSPPVAQPIPRFIADSSREGRPAGRWAERVTEAFATECERHAEEAGARLDPETLRWFPDRTWGGRAYMPVIGGAKDSEIEYFGYVAFQRAEDGSPQDLRASAEFTDVTAEDNPDWRIDLNEEVIGAWQTDGGRGGDVTLIWGLPLIRGAIAATAELEGEVLDQAPVQDGRFTLVAVDAVHGFGDDLYLTIRLWSRSLRELASESLYEEPEGEEPEGEEPEGEERKSAE